MAIRAYTDFLYLILHLLEKNVKFIKFGLKKAISLRRMNTFLKMFVKSKLTPRKLGISILLDIFAKKCYHFLIISYNHPCHFYNRIIVFFSFLTEVK